jgi:hypothetical protein
VTYTYVGITGRRKSGKDSLADIAMKTFGGTRWAFADALKRQCGRIFGLSAAQMYDQSLKEVKLHAPVVMDDFITYMQIETGLDIQPRGIVVQTPREIMQFYGTEYVRSVQDSYWIDKLNEVDPKNGPIWITDMRFDNEVDKVKSFDGLTLRVKRLVSVDGLYSSHASEARIDELPVDHEVWNDSTLDEFNASVTQLLLDLGFATNDVDRLHAPW